MKIVILDGFTTTGDDLAWTGWESLGELVVYDRTPADEVVARAADAEAVLTNKVVLDADVLARLPRLRYVGVLATGYNVVDIAAASARGIVVTNIPAYSTASVAQLVFAHLTNITNRVALHHEAVNCGQWQRSPDFCFRLSPQMELAGKTMGILGLGNIGMAVAHVAMAMGMHVLALSSKPAEVLAQQGIQKAADVDQLFREADVLSLHCPLTPSTRHIVNARTLSLMKSTAIFINTGRGPLVDEQALADALRARRLYAAALDVLEQEPPRRGSALIGVPGCWVTPHIAWATREARQRLIAIARSNLEAFMAGRPANQIN